MKDIARDLNLSIVTISKALRNHPDIADDTRERVLRRVKELDYQPNIMARSLVTGRSYLIGLVVPDLIHPFFAEIAKVLSAIVGKRGYSVIISSSEEDPQLEYREIKHLTARRLDGLVIASAGNDIEPFERMDRMGMPYVLIDRELRGLDANYVGIDDETAGRLATEHLIDQGCRVVAHIRGRENSTGTQRFLGYKNALKRRGIKYSESLVVDQLSTEVETSKLGAEAMRILLKHTTIPDGVFAYNDALAIGAMDAILEAGLRVPEDIAVIGCGNLHYIGSLRVPLSSIDQNSSVIGQRTAAILLGMIESKSQLDTVSVILEPSLIVRASTMRSTPALNGTGKAKAKRA